MRGRVRRESPKRLLPLRLRGHGFAAPALVCGDDDMHEVPRPDGVAAALTAGRQRSAAAAKALTAGGLAWLEARRAQQEQTTSADDTDAARAAFVEFFNPPPPDAA